jgi:hypothetical protein
MTDRKGRQLTSLDKQSSASGLIPNFARLYKAYDANGRYVGVQNDYFEAQNLQQAKLRMESNPYFRPQKERAKLIREFNISDGMWEALRSKTPARVIERDGIQLPDMTKEGRRFMRLAREKYNIEPPFFRSSGGGAWTTNLIKSPIDMAMFKLTSGQGIAHKYSSKELGHQSKILNRKGQYTTYNNGLVPNFANPLQDAIQREANAGVPKSLIRVDQDFYLILMTNLIGKEIRRSIVRVNMHLEKKGPQKPQEKPQEKRGEQWKD